MRLPGEEDSGGSSGMPVVYMLFIVAAFVAVVIFLVFQDNKKNSGSAYLKEIEQQKKEAQEIALEEAEAESEENEKPKLRAEDLDFWDMYPVEEEQQGTDNMQYNNTAEEDSGKSEKTPFEEKAEKDREEQARKQEEEKDPSKDGKHTLVTKRDGTEEWVLISPVVPKNNYDFTKIEEKAGIKRYMENDRSVSFVGVDISKQTGDVKFDRMKAAGVDYVMIKVGSRGYSSGQIMLDEKFKSYIDGALEAGLEVGAYFSSQAISPEEAIAEVNFVVENLEPYRGKIKYPVAFEMKFAANDISRIDGVSKEDKTAIATSFMEGIRAAGYMPMLCGDKEWLMAEIDMAKLTDFPVWLVQESDMPDYPYNFHMWQYSTKGVLNGIEGNTNLNICFVNYSER